MAETSTFDESKSPPLPQRNRTSPTPSETALQKLNSGEITPEEYKIITTASQRYRTLSDAADKNLLGSQLGNDLLATKNKARFVDPYAASSNIPSDETILRANLSVYIESAVGGFISVNDGYATLRTMDYAVPLILVHADRNKYNTPIREGDVIFLRWGKAWLRGHPTSSYMTFEDGPTPDYIGQSAAFRVTDLVADRSGFSGTKLSSRQELNNGTEFGLTSIYWKRCMIGAYTINPSPTEPRYLLNYKPGRKKGVRPIPFRCISKSYCDSRKVQHHAQRKQQLVHHGNRILSSNLHNNATSDALRRVTAGPLGLPSGRSSNFNANNANTANNSNTANTANNFNLSSSPSSKPSLSSSSSSSTPIVVRNIDTGESIDIDVANDVAVLLHGMDEKTRTRELLETKQLLETIHAGIAVRIGQRKGEFETALLPAMISKITAMNGSRRMLIDEKLKLEKNISENLTGMVSNETLELYEQIESVILQTHQGMDHAKAQMYFPECDGYRYRFGSTPTESKSGMSGGTFLGLHDFAIESFRAKYSIQIESSDGNIHIGVPRVVIQITNVQISLILFGVHLKGEKKSGVPEFKRPRVVLDLEFSLNSEFQFRSEGYTGPNGSNGSKGESSGESNGSNRGNGMKSNRSRFGKMSSGLNTRMKSARKGMGKGMGKAKDKMGSGMSSMSKMGKGISKKGLKSISTMKMKMKEIRYKMKEKKRLKKLKKKKKNKKKKGELGEDNEEDEEEEDEDDTSSMNSSTLGSIGSPNGSVDGSYSETKSSTSSQNSASTSTSPIDMPNFRRKLNKGPVCNWEVERFSFKIDKINSLKGTPLPKRVIKMLLNSILPKAIENAIKGALNEAFGIYLSETPGQRCLLAGEITLSGTGLDVFDSTVGKHNDIILIASNAAEYYASNMTSTTAKTNKTQATLKAVASSQALEVLGGLDPDQAHVLFTLGTQMKLQTDGNGVEEGETKLKWETIADLCEYARYVHDNSNEMTERSNQNSPKGGNQTNKTSNSKNRSNSNNGGDEWALLLHAWQKAADAMCRSPMQPLSITKIFAKIEKLRRKPLHMNITQHVIDMQGDIAPAILMFRQSVEATMGRMIDQHQERQLKKSKSSSSTSRRKATANALAIRRATIALQQVFEWEKGWLASIKGWKSKIKRANGNVLFSLIGGSRGVIDVCGDKMILQLPAGMEKYFQDMEWLKSPITNLIHIEKEQGGRFYFDLVIDENEMNAETNDVIQNTTIDVDGEKRRKGIIEGSMRSMKRKKNKEEQEQKEQIKPPPSPLRQSNFLRQSSLEKSDDLNVNDAIHRLYNNPDQYLRILSLSFRRARTTWNIDREKMLQLLLESNEEEDEDEDKEGGSIDLWAADMALEGIDDTKEEAVLRKKRNLKLKLKLGSANETNQNDTGIITAASAAGGDSHGSKYMLRTTWLPYSKLMFNVLDWRLLGPPWRVTQWMTGTLDNAQEGTGSSSAGSRAGATAVTMAKEEKERERKKNNLVDDDVATRPFRVVMSALRRYVTSPDLSLKCAVSVLLDGGDDDDLSFFFDDEEDVVDDNTMDSAEMVNGEGKEDIQEQGDEAEAPNIAFAVSNWEQGTTYFPKRMEGDSNDDGNATTRKGLMDGTMAEFNITFSIQDLIDDKAAYDIAYGETVDLES